MSLEVEPVIIAICSLCGETIQGIRQGNYLLPTWTLKANSAKILPHGPRLIDLATRECWVCSMENGKDWHR